MDTGTRWAVHVAKVAGALTWGLGLLLHLQTVSIITWSLEALGRGWGLATRYLGWSGLLFGSLLVVSGPVVVAVGGGLRFVAGMLSGQKVAGERVGRIALFEWLRYELLAAGGGLVIGGFFAVGNFAPTGTNWDMGLALGLLAGYELVGAFALLGAHRFNRKSKALMWELREEGRRRGMVPYPADAVPSASRFSLAGWQEEKAETENAQDSPPY